MSINFADYNYVNNIPMNAELADNLLFRWKKLSLYRQHKIQEADKFEKIGCINPDTFKIFSKSASDDFFFFLYNRADKALKIIEKEIKPKIFNFYKSIKK